MGSLARSVRAEEPPAAPDDPRGNSGLSPAREFWFCRTSRGGNDGCGSGRLPRRGNTGLRGSLPARASPAADPSLPASHFNPIFTKTFFSHVKKSNYTFKTLRDNQVRASAVPAAPVTATRCALEPDPVFTCRRQGQLDDPMLSTTAHLSWAGHGFPTRDESTWIGFHRDSCYERSPSHQVASPRRTPLGAARLLHPSMVLPAGEPRRRADARRAKVLSGCLGGSPCHLRATRSSQCAG